MVSPMKKEAEAPRNYLSDEKALKRFVRQMIKNHHFVGSYLEKRYVPHLGCYKKIVKISITEDIFIENLLIIKRRLETFYKNTKWVGITTSQTPGAPEGFNIWVDIDEEILGVYKFNVKDVLFFEDQVVLKLQMIKPYNQKSTLRESSFVKSSSSFFNNSESLIEDNDKPIFTLDNFKNSMLFIFLLTVTIITGFGQIVKYLLEYILKVVEVSTPIIIALFNMITRMFGYMCFLVAFLWKGGEQPNKKFNDVGYKQIVYYQPAYPYQNRYKALPYREKSTVCITEVED